MKFMVSTGLQGSAVERNTLIPQEQAHIKTLREKGIVEALYISADRPYVWIVMQGDSKEFILQTLQSLPLYPYATRDYAFNVQVWLTARCSLFIVQCV